MNLVNLSLQIVPVNTAAAYPIIDKAIEVIQQSGVRYKITPFATILEGELSTLLELVEQAKEAALAAGGKELLLNMQIHLKQGEDVHFEDKTAKFN